MSCFISVTRQRPRSRILLPGKILKKSVEKSELLSFAGSVTREESQFWVGISPILFIMFNALAVGGYVVYNQVKRPKS